MRQSPGRVPPLRLALGVVLLALASGCAMQSRSTTAARSTGAAQQILALDDERFASLGFRRDWTGFPLVSGGGRISEVYVDPNNVLVLESGSTVSYLDPDSGQLRWNNELASPLTKFLSLLPYVYNGVEVVMVSSESDLYVLNRDTGDLMDRQRLSPVCSSGPVLLGNMAIYGTASGQIMGHAINPGTRAWGHDLTGPIETGPTYVDGVIAGVADSGQIAFLNPTDGGLYSRTGIFAGTSTEPINARGFLVVASLDQSVYAFEPRTGRMMWRYRTAAPLRVQPTPHADRVYVEITGKGLTALNRATGAVLWESPEVSGTVIGVGRDRLIVWDDGMRVAFLVSPSSGVVHDRVELPGVGGLWTDRFEDGNLYAYGPTGGVAKFVPRF